MTDGQQKLTTTQVLEADLADWRQILQGIRARFHTRNFATGLTLVNRIGDAAAAANHHPDILLNNSDVIVTLTSQDAGGVADRDVALARRISDFAADLGITSDVAALTQVELGLDTASAGRLAPFYAALLGGTTGQSELVDASGQVPTVWWQEPDERDAQRALPHQSLTQRWHLDVWVPHDEGERRLTAVLASGGRLVSDRAAPAYWVVEDADGNRSCICTSAGR